MKMWRTSDEQTKNYREWGIQESNNPEIRDSRNWESENFGFRQS